MPKVDNRPSSPSLSAKTGPGSPSLTPKNQIPTEINNVPDTQTATAAAQNTTTVAPKTTSAVADKKTSSPVVDRKAVPSPAPKATSGVPDPNKPVPEKKSAIAERAAVFERKNSENSQNSPLMEKRRAASESNKAQIASKATTPAGKRTSLPPGQRIAPAFPIPEKKTAVPEKKTAVPEKKTAVPEKKTSPSEKTTAEKRAALYRSPSVEREEIRKSQLYANYVLGQLDSERDINEVESNLATTTSSIQAEIENLKGVPIVFFSFLVLHTQLR